MQTNKGKKGTSNVNHLALGAPENHWTTPLLPSDELSLRHLSQDADERNSFVILWAPLGRSPSPVSEQAELIEGSPKTHKPVSCLIVPPRKEPLVKVVSGTAVVTVCACSEDVGLLHTTTTLCSALSLVLKGTPHQRLPATRAAPTRCVKAHLN